MAKRLTDTGKWNKPFVRSLQAPYKLLWFYILDECDHAGIWQVDEDVAKIRIGCGVDFNEAQKVFKNHIQIFDDGQKWFIPDFIDFQYGELNPANKVHLSVLTIHKKYKIKPLTSPLQGAKDKDMDKEKDKGGLGEKYDGYDFSESFISALEKWFKYRNEIKKPYKSNEAIKAFLDNAKKLGEDEFIKMANHSMSNQYQGLIPDKNEKPKQFSPHINGINIDEQFK